MLERLAGAELGSALSAEAIEALRKGMLDELDYKSEAANLEGFRQAFAGDPEIVIPRPLPELSSARVLTMERLTGETLASFVPRAAAARRDAVARVMFRFTWKGPVLYGLCNADPNPGNYLVVDADPAHTRVGFLDFGCAVEIDDKLYDADRRLWLSMIHRDGEALRYAVYEQGLIADMKVLDTNTFRAWEEKLAAPFLDRTPYTLTPAHVRELNDLTSRLTRARGIKLPAHAVLLWRQRLGALSVIAQLRPTLPFRQLLAEILDDGRNPISLYERYP